MELKGKVALVTGGARGIGRGIALAIAKEGADVAVNYLRHPDSAEEVAKNIEKIGVKAITVQADVSDSKQVSKMVDTIIEKWGRIDVLVNNAGYMEGGKLLDIPEEKWDRMMAVHLRGPFLCCKAVVPHMIKQHAQDEGWTGKIINISSVGGTSGLSVLHYCTAKGGLITFTQSLARDLAQYNIMVNVVAPGPTISDLGSPEPRTEEQYEMSRKRAKEKGDFPLGRVGEPEDISGAVLFFIHNDYVTGELINVSGGWGTLYSKLNM